MDTRRSDIDDRTGFFLSRIEASKHLPSLPQVLLNLMEACRNEEATFKEITQIIGGDSALTARILRIVNSPYYRRAEKIVRIEDALFQLGRDAVRNIAISASIHQIFSKVNDRSPFHMKLFWWHSLLCAVLARRLSEKLSYKAPDLSFLTGILHDVGRMVLWVNFPEEYGKVLQAARRRSHLLLEGERRMGITHSEAGSWLLNRWGLDASAVDAVRCHHDSPERIESAVPLVKILYVANLVADLHESDLSQNVVIRELIGLGLDEVMEMRSVSQEEVRELAEALDIQIDPVDLFPIDGKDKEKHEELTGEVCDFSLLQAALQGLMAASDGESIRKAIRHGIEILFGTPAVLLFLHDQERELLVLQDIADSILPAGQELTIPMERSDSLAVKALTQRAMVSTQELHDRRTLTISDDKMIRILRSEEILCLPLMTQKEAVGVLVIGADRAVVPSLFAKTRVLTLYADQVAVALHLDRIRKTQTRLYQAGRLAATLELARKVAHEVNNPLSIIKNYIKILSIKLGNDNLVRNELRIVNEEIDRVALIVRQLTDLSSDKNSIRQTVDVNGMIQDLVAIIEKSFTAESRIRFHLDLDPQLPGLVTDQNGLKQVLINLVKNSIEAMEQGGNLFVRTKGLVSRKREAPSLKHERKIESYVEISVRDDGPGLSEAVKQRLFEPYVTTKGESHLGLGFSVVYSIVKKLGGTIQCESAKGKGTAFVMRFPVNGNTKAA